MLLLKFKRFMDADEDADGGATSVQAQEGEAKPETSAEKLAKALKEQKKNSVSKADYDKLKKENEELVAQIINGEGDAGNGQQDTPPKKSIEELREALYGPKAQDLNNLEAAKLTLELRKAVMEKDGKDPFLPYGANIKPTSEDVEKAQHVADVFQECITEAKGDNGVFTALLQSRINPDSPVLTAHLKKLALKK